MTVPVNLLLLGSESWALKKSSLNRVVVFLLRSIRRIMRIKMSEARDKELSNEKLRDMFYHIANIRELITKRQYRFTGSSMSPRF